MDSSSVEKAIPDPVKQFSIFTENKVGRLRNLVIASLIRRDLAGQLAIDAFERAGAPELGVCDQGPQRRRRRRPRRARWWWRDRFRERFGGLHGGVFSRSHR